MSSTLLSLPAELRLHILSYTINIVPDRRGQFEIHSDLENVCRLLNSDAKIAEGVWLPPTTTLRLNINDRDGRSLCKRLEKLNIRFQEVAKRRGATWFGFDTLEIPAFVDNGKGPEDDIYMQDFERLKSVPDIDHHDSLEAYIKIMGNIWGDGDEIPYAPFLAFLPEGFKRVNYDITLPEMPDLLLSRADRERILGKHVCLQVIRVALHIYYKRWKERTSSIPGSPQPYRRAILPPLESFVGLELRATGTLSAMDREILVCATRKLDQSPRIPLHVHSLRAYGGEVAPLFEFFMPQEPEAITEQVSQV